MQESFKDALDGFSLTVDFEKAAPQLSFEQPTQTISQEQAQALVTLNADGTVMVDEAGVRVLVDSWAAIYDISNTKYQFKSEVDGYVPIQFLDVSYKVELRRADEGVPRAAADAGRGRGRARNCLLPKRRAVRHQGYVH